MPISRGTQTDMVGLQLDGTAPIIVKQKKEDIGEVGQIDERQQRSPFRWPQASVVQIRMMNGCSMHGIRVPISPSQTVVVLMHIHGKAHVLNLKRHAVLR